MGRCYEFGAIIHEGCDHAMVVSSEGGTCVCNTCGSSCPGRFSGCGSILAQPGYVPVLAPRWATDPSVERPAHASTLVLDTPAPTTSTANATNGVAKAEVVAPAQQQVRILELLESMSRSDEVQELFTELRESLQGRDVELAQTFERLEKAYERMTETVAEVADQQQRLFNALAALEGRVDTLTDVAGRPMFPALRGRLRRD